ncbi:MAG: hypothetical protein ACUVRD_04450 [Bacteroidia bacterium]
MSKILLVSFLLAQDSCWVTPNPFSQYSSYVSGPHISKSLIAGARKKALLKPDLTTPWNPKEIQAFLAQHPKLHLVEACPEKNLYKLLWKEPATQFSIITYLRHDKIPPWLKKNLIPQKMPTFPPQKYVLYIPLQQLVEGEAFTDTNALLRESIAKPLHALLKAQGEIIALQVEGKFVLRDSTLLFKPKILKGVAIQCPSCLREVTWGKKLSQLKKWKFQGKKLSLYLAERQYYYYPVQINDYYPFSVREAFFWRYLIEKKKTRLPLVSDVCSETLSPYKRNLKPWAEKVLLEAQ